MQSIPPTVMFVHHASSRPREVTTFLIVESERTPKSVPTILPTPPDSNVPPMIDEAIANVLAEIIKDDMTLAQKANAIYLYTYDNIAYTGNSDKDDYRKEAYNGITKKQGDCYTYFAVAKALLNEIGAATIDVERAPGVRNDHHYWLLVDLGTGYYHFDATRRAYWFNGFMATDAQVNAYSTNVVNGFYYFDTTLYPATPTEEFTFEQYTGTN